MFDRIRYWYVHGGKITLLNVLVIFLWIDIIGGGIACVISGIISFTNSMPGLGVLMLLSAGVVVFVGLLCIGIVYGERDFVQQIMGTYKSVMRIKKELANKNEEQNNQ